MLFLWEKKKRGIGILWWLLKLLRRNVALLAKKAVEWSLWPVWQEGVIFLQRGTMRFRIMWVYKWSCLWRARIYPALKVEKMMEWCGHGERGSNKECRWKGDWDQLFISFEYPGVKCTFYLSKMSSYFLFLCRYLIILVPFSGSSLKNGWKR